MEMLCSSNGGSLAVASVAWMEVFADYFSGSEGFSVVFVTFIFLLGFAIAVNETQDEVNTTIEYMIESRDLTFLPRHSLEDWNMSPC